jgi:hypothetical protein
MIGRTPVGRRSAMPYRFCNGPDTPESQSEAQAVQFAANVEVVIVANELGKQDQIEGCRSITSTSGGT